MCVFYTDLDHCDFIFVCICVRIKQILAISSVLSAYFACLSLCLFRRKTLADNTLIHFSDANNFLLFSQTLNRQLYLKQKTGLNWLLFQMFTPIAVYVYIYTRLFIYLCTFHLPHRRNKHNMFTCMFTYTVY